MAPDLNSVPPSPRNALSSFQTSTASSRRTSQLMGPPPAPASDTNSRITGGTRESAASPSIPSVMPVTAMADNTGVGTGPGPLRHPRPLTAADLHLQLEQEQEAVVNRLTRELSLLRQQSASVASTTSSTSTGLGDFPDHNQNHMAFGASHPTPSRRHRSSSSLSTRSINAPNISSTTVSGIAPTRDNTAHVSGHNSTLSRQNSMASSRRSEASSPSLSSSLIHGDHFPVTLPQRQSFVHQHPHSSTSQSSQQTHNPDVARSPNRTSAIFNARYEEIALHRSQLDAVKQENEALRRRIKDLERSLSNRNQPNQIRENQSIDVRRDSANAGISTTLTTSGP